MTLSVAILAVKAHATGSRILTTDSERGPIMILLRPFRRIAWLILFAPLFMQGCTTAGSTGWSSATFEENPCSNAGIGLEEKELASAEMAPFLGNWQGTWEQDYGDKSLATTSETRRALLNVKMVCGKPIATWALGTGNYGGTRRDSNTYSPPSLGRYPAKFGKKDGIAFMEFTTRLGYTYRIYRESSQLRGEHTSGGSSIRCMLTSTSQEELFTGSALAQFGVTFN
jgi:hypothetical protein